MAVAVRRDIEARKTADAGREGNGGLVLVRMRAVVEAQQAVAAKEVWARPAYRDALVSLAAACEAAAAELRDLAA